MKLMAIQALKTIGGKEWRLEFTSFLVLASHNDLDFRGA
jgi:hypothetical protein